MFYRKRTIAMYKVLIGGGLTEPHHSCEEFDLRSSALIELWAYAKSAWPDYARFFDGEGWVSNSHMRDAEIPKKMEGCVLRRVKELDQAVIDDYPKIEPFDFVEAASILAEIDWQLHVYNKIDILGRVYPEMMFQATWRKPMQNKSAPVMEFVPVSEVDLSKGIHLRPRRKQTIFSAQDLQALVEKCWKFSKMVEAGWDE